MHPQRAAALLLARLRAASPHQLPPGGDGVVLHVHHELAHHVAASRLPQPIDVLLDVTCAHGRDDERQHDRGSAQRPPWRAAHCSGVGDISVVQDSLLPR